MDKNYTLVKGGRDLVSLDDLETAQDGLEYFGDRTYIRYNQPGIDNYEDAKRWEQENGKD